MYRSPFTAKCEMTTPFKKAGSWSAGYHTGEDWICNSDRTLVSPADGTVSYVGYDSSYGNHLVIHTDDRKCILMAHMENLPCVKQGQHITAGTKVGMEGNTGNSTGYHLHIEVQSIPEWNYAKNLLKPSNYIDFNDFGDNRFIARDWKNGSTVEKTFGTTKDCLAKEPRKWAVGYVEPYATATVRARYKACPCITYPASDGTTRIGFVQWEGGQKQQNYKTIKWTNGSTPEKVYSTTGDCKTDRKSYDTLQPKSWADCIGIVDGCYAIVYRLNDGHYKCGFVRYNGGV